MEGWIALWRKLQDSEIWHKPDKWIKIWLHILFNVSHKNNKYPRGTYYFKYSWIAKDTAATDNQVERCVQWLREQEQIATQKATHGIIISVLNYHKYQDIKKLKSDTESDTKSDTDAVTEATQKRHRSDNISNNGNNENNGNNRRGRFPPPTLQEVSEYINQHGHKIDPQHFVDKQEERGWELKNGKKIKDWRATIRTWERNEKKWSEPKYEDIFDEIASRLHDIFVKDSKAKIGEIPVFNLFDEFSLYNNHRSDEFLTDMVSKLSKNQSFINKLRSYVPNEN